VLAYDEFAARVVIRGGRKHSPPWGWESPDTPWSDHHEAQTRIWFHGQRINAHIGDVGPAVQTAARSNGFHPVHDYFEALVWDGVPRLDRWLIDYCGAEDTPYHRAIAPCYLISGVARIYEPGCKADHMIVLEHDQGKLKSEFLRTLCPNSEWFTDTLSHIKSKDAALETAGVFMVEIAEMEPLLRPSSSAAKAFVTRRFERVRPPWGTHPVRRGRQFIFAGTINPPTTGYFRDPTGSRRYWPVRCGHMLDVKGIEAARDRIWAEAVHRYKAKEKWWLSPELEHLAEEEQDLRYRPDVWHDPVCDWIGNRLEVAVAEVLEEALGFSPQSWTVGAERRVGAILTRLKFRKDRPRKDGERHRIYRRDQPPAKE
jgi:predicted P-loop ATPase